MQCEVEGVVCGGHGECTPTGCDCDTYYSGIENCTTTYYDELGQRVLIMPVVALSSYLICLSAISLELIIHSKWLAYHHPPAKKAIFSWVAKILLTLSCAFGIAWHAVQIYDVITGGIPSLMALGVVGSLANIFLIGTINLIVIEWFTVIEKVHRLEDSPRVFRIPRRVAFVVFCIAVPLLVTIVVFGNIFRREIPSLNPLNNILVTVYLCAISVSILVYVIRAFRYLNQLGRESRSNPAVISARRKNTVIIIILASVFVFVILIITTLTLEDTAAKFILNESAAILFSLVLLVTLFSFVQTYAWSARTKAYCGYRAAWKDRDYRLSGNTPSAATPTSTKSSTRSTLTMSTHVGRVGRLSDVVSASLYLSGTSSPDGTLSTKTVLVLDSPAETEVSAKSLQRSEDQDPHGMTVTSTSRVTTSEEEEET